MRRLPRFDDGFEPLAVGMPKCSSEPLEGVGVRAGALFKERISTLRRSISTRAASSTEADGAGDAGVDAVPWEVLLRALVFSELGTESFDKIALVGCVVV